MNTKPTQDEITARNTANMARWRENNREHFNAYHKAYRSDPQRKIAFTYRIRLSEVVARAAGRNNSSRISEQRFTWLTGLTKAEFIEHLKANFKPGMSFENYGKRKDQWSIDHTVACSQFDLTNDEQLRKCFRYTNLLPMWHSENSKKARKERDRLASITACQPAPDAAQSTEQSES